MKMLINQFSKKCAYLCHYTVTDETIHTFGHQKLQDFIVKTMVLLEKNLQLLASTCAHGFAHMW